MTRNPAHTEQSLLDGDGGPPAIIIKDAKTHGA